MPCEACFTDKSKVVSRRCMKNSFLASLRLGVKLYIGIKKDYLNGQMLLSVPVIL